MEKFLGGLNIMALGMGVVFAFLILLICVITFVGHALKDSTDQEELELKEAAKKDAELRKKKLQNAKLSQQPIINNDQENSKIVAVITAAINAFRKSN
ncbi:MAG: hypothetical protein COA79_23950 [Planctomycetota bacterium]|nr:MAG: hypothetical protein COA79_23950 [Planctomycetota bacterium]